MEPNCVVPEWEALAYLCAFAAGCVLTFLGCGLHCALRSGRHKAAALSARRAEQLRDNLF